MVPVRFTIFLVVCCVCAAAVTSSSQEEIQGRRQPGNEFPMQYHPKGTNHSSVHCVGENFGPGSWLYRSCHFRNLCIDTAKGDFVVFPSSRELKLQAHARQMGSSVTISSLLSFNQSSVSIGSISPSWSKQDIERLRWFPRVETEPPDEGFYTLATEHVMVPFHSMFGATASRLILDDFMPVYALLQIFGLSQKKLLPLRHVLPSFIPETCGSSLDACHNMFQKFSPALMGPEQTSGIPSVEDFVRATSGDTKKSTIVCAPHAAAGLLSHSRAATRMPSELSKDSHTHARGASLLGFSRFLYANLGIPFSKIHVQRGSSRRVSFALFQHEQLNAFVERVKLRLEAGDGVESKSIVVESHSLESLSIAQHVQAVIESDVFVCVDENCGEVAAFLSPGSGLVVLDLGKNEVKSDWDLLASATHLRVHFFSLYETSTRSEEALAQLIHSELEQDFTARS